jgi:hypothetical protein
LCELELADHEDLLAHLGTRKSLYAGHLGELELADHEDLLAHLGTGKPLYAGHLSELELAVHEDSHAFVQLTPEKYNITGSDNIYSCTDIRTHFA